MAYQSFKDEEGQEYGSFEVFRITVGNIHDLAPGWYWWPCFPGCMPDSDTPNGPFDTEAEAIADAQEES